MAKFGSILVYVVLLAAACSVAKAEELLESGWDYECSFDGERHAHEIACDRYYECRVNGIGGWNIFLYRCPYGYQYSDLFNTCLQGFCGGPVSTTESEESTKTIEPITDYPETEEPTTTDYEATDEPTTTDYEATEEPTTTDYEETDEPTTTDYEATEEPTTTDYEGTDEPTTTDYEETDEPTTTDYEATEEPTTTDYEATEEPTTTDYEATEEPTTTDYEATDEPTTTDYEATKDPTTTDYPVTEEPTTPEDPVTEEPTTVVPEFLCVKSGYFTDPLNCAVFHHCVCDSNGQCTDNVKQCPVNYHFCEEYQTCGTDNFCACTTPYRGFYYY